jgi:hypothetical protein
MSKKTNPKKIPDTACYANRIQVFTRAKPGEAGIRAVFAGEPWDVMHPSWNFPR